MSGITRADLYLRSLKVHNQSSNIMEMDLQGNLNLNTKNINSEVKEDLNLKSIGNQNIGTINGNLTLSSKNSSVILRNGEYQNDESLLYTYNDIDVDDNDTQFFNNNEIVKPYTNKEDVVGLRDNSLLIESLNSNIPITLYSNSGINLLSHNGIKSITDGDCVVQGNRINFTSLGFITLNSERLISSSEEDISFFSSTGDILIGGNGVTNNGIKISSNLNNNFVGIGKNDDAKNILDIELKHPSVDNRVKNGLTISNSNGSTNSSNDLINPEIVLKNSNTDAGLTMGIGLNDNDENLKIIAKKLNINSKTYLKPLNFFNFNLTDIGNRVTWMDTNFLSNEIIGIYDDPEHGILANINTESNSFVNNFQYQIGYINRNNNSYIRTQNSSNLSLGTNDRNILNISNTGNIGIGTENPEGNLHVLSQYGLQFNNKIDKNRRYFNPKSIQFLNGNILVVSNTLKNSLYNLEGFLYNNNNLLITNFTIIENSREEITFGIDNLDSSKDVCVICYCYKHFNTAEVECFFTETNIYKNNGRVYSNTLKNTIEHSINLVQPSYPNVKSISNSIIEGYALVYNDIDPELDSNNFVYSMVQIFKNFTPENQMENIFNSTTDLFTGQNILRFNSSINLLNQLIIKSRYLDIEFDSLNNDIIISYSNEIIGGSTTYYHSYIQRFTLSENAQIYSLTRRNFNNLVLPIEGENSETTNDFTQYIIDGVKIKIISSSDNTRVLRCVFYLKNTERIKKSFYIKNITFQQGSTFLSNDSQKIQDINESNINNNIYDIPGIDIKNNNDNVISWINNNNLYYRNDTNEIGITKQVFTSQPNQVFVKCIRNITGTYKETLIMWNNNNTGDIVNYNSVTLQSVLSDFNLIKFQNINSNFNIKNSGEVIINSNDKINFNDSLEIDKSKSVVNIKTNLVLSSLDENPTSGNVSGEEGQINYINNELYIYIGGNWRRIQLV